MGALFLALTFVASVPMILVNVVVGSNRAAAENVNVTSYEQSQIFSEFTLSTIEVHQRQSDVTWLHLLYTMLNTFLLFWFYFEMTRHLWFGTIFPLHRLHRWCLKKINREKHYEYEV